MARYATGTTVTAAQTAGEIMGMLGKRGVSKIGQFDDGERYSLMFEYTGVAFRISLPLPDPNDPKFTQYFMKSKPFTRTEGAVRELFEKEVNRRWRAFGAVIKAKLVAVDEGISTMEEEFIGNVVMQGGSTLAEQYAPKLPALQASGHVKALEGPRG